MYYYEFSVVFNRQNVQKIVQLFNPNNDVTRNAFCTINMIEMNDLYTLKNIHVIPTKEYFTVYFCAWKIARIIIIKRRNTFTTKEFLWEDGRC